MTAARIGNVEAIVFADVGAFTEAKELARDLFVDARTAPGGASLSSWIDALEDVREEGHGESLLARDPLAHLVHRGPH